MRIRRAAKATVEMRRVDYRRRTAVVLARRAIQKRHTKTSVCFILYGWQLPLVRRGWNYAVIPLSIRFARLFSSNAHATKSRLGGKEETVRVVEREKR